MPEPAPTLGCSRVRRTAARNSRVQNLRRQASRPLSQPRLRHGTCPSRSGRKKSAARLAKDRRRLNQKHLASKVWAYVRVASRLLAWSVRARVRCALNRARWGCEAQRALLDKFVERAASLGLREAAAATAGGAAGSRLPFEPKGGNK